MKIKDYFLNTFNHYTVHFDSLNNFLFVRLYDGVKFIAKFKIKGNSIIGIYLHPEYEKDIDRVFRFTYDLTIEKKLCIAVNLFLNNKVMAAFFKSVDRRFRQIQDANIYDNLRQYDMDTSMYLETYPRFELQYRTCGKIYYAQFFIFDSNNYPHSIFAISFLLPKYTVHILYSVELNTFISVQGLFKDLPIQFHEKTFEHIFESAKPIKDLSTYINDYHSYDIMFTFVNMITNDRSLTEHMLPSIDSLDNAIDLLNMMYI